MTCANDDGSDTPEQIVVADDFTTTTLLSSATMEILDEVTGEFYVADDVSSTHLQHSLSTQNSVVSDIEFACDISDEAQLSVPSHVTDNMQ